MRSSGDDFHYDLMKEEMDEERFKEIALDSIALEKKTGHSKPDRIY